MSDNPDRIMEADRLNLRIADLRTALAQSQAKLAEAVFELEKARIARAYTLAEGESVSIDTGVITRRSPLVAVP